MDNYNYNYQKPKDLGYSTTLSVNESDLFGTKSNALIISEETPLNNKNYEEDSIARERKVYYEVFFIVMPLFCGYATLFALQRKVLDIVEGEKPEPAIWGTATSMLYIGNLIFRMGHNFFFFFARPRNRVLISMSSMCLSMIILSIVCFQLKQNTPIELIFLSYGLGGVGIGSFESNLLSCITILGKDTKFWAIFAMPTGVVSITIGSFLLFNFDWVSEHPGIVHLSVLCYILVGITIFVFRIYGRSATEENTYTLREFLRLFLYWKDWLWIIKWNCLAMMFDMFFVSLFSPGVVLYIFPDTEPVYFHWSGKSMNNPDFIALYNACFFLGDAGSRRLLYSFRPLPPFVFLLLSGAGAGIVALKIAELIPLCGFLVGFANGSIYSQTTRKIDSLVPVQYNLVSLSFWLFVGDIGAVVGSNTISYVQKIFAEGSTE